ncbi:hypothetical protein V1515DRAFT_617464 [Lipomyces mesembrius]
MTNNRNLLIGYAPSPAISPHSGSSDSRNEAAENRHPATKFYNDRLALFTINVWSFFISRDPRTSLRVPGEIWHDLELMALIRAYHAAVNVCRSGSSQRFFGVVDDVWRRFMARLDLPVKPMIAPMYLEHVWMNIVASFRTIAYHIIKNNGRPWYDYSKAYHARILNSLPSITPQIYHELDSQFSHSFTQHLHSILNGLYSPVNFRPSTGHEIPKEILSGPSGPVRSNKSTADALLLSFRTLYSKIVAGRVEDLSSLSKALTMSLLTEGADSHVGNEILSALEEYMEFEEMITLQRQVFCEQLIAQ